MRTFVLFKYKNRLRLNQNFVDVLKKMYCEILQLYSTTNHKIKKNSIADSTVKYQFPNDYYDQGTCQQKESARTMIYCFFSEPTSTPVVIIFF